MMKTRIAAHTALGLLGAIALFVASGRLAVAQTPLMIEGARVTISGTSNVHSYTASTTAIQVKRASVANTPAGTDIWTHALTPGAVEAFEIAVRAETLTSPREGLDKNMHKALKVKEYPEITFRLLRLEPGSSQAGALRGVGALKIAGVEREVVLDIATERKNSTLSVHGQVQLLMTDFGIKPPVAMLGMLKTDPKVTVSFETVLAIPST